MKKKTYKRMKNRLYRETVARIREHEARKEAEEQYRKEKDKADRYKRRFIDIGLNMHTPECDQGIVKLLKCEVTPEQWGLYSMASIEDCEQREAIIKEMHAELANKIAKGLIEHNFIQFTHKKAEEHPLGRLVFFGAKLFIVPWEQMPHRRTIELVKMLEKGIDYEEENNEGL